MKTNAKWMVAALIATAGLSNAAWSADGAARTAPDHDSETPARATIILCINLSASRAVNRRFGFAG